MAFRFVRLSVLLHVLLLLVMLAIPLTSGDGEDAGGDQAAAQKKDEPIDVTIVDPPAEESAPVVEDEGVEMAKRVPHAGDTCEHFYGGIGIIDGIDGVVEVYPGYPAHIAGIKPGDLIQSGEPIRGAVGTPLTIVVVRGLRHITFHLIRDKICIA